MADPKKEMVQPGLEEFVKQAEQANLIPVFTEVPANEETPLSISLKIGGSFILENATRNGHFTGYSYIGANPSKVFKIKSSKLEIVEDDKSSAYEISDPYEVLRESLSKFRPAVSKELPPFFGGIAGYLGYDLALHTENLAVSNVDELNLPDALLFFIDTLVAFNHTSRKIKIIKLATVNTEKEAKEAYEHAKQVIGRLIEQLKGKPKRQMKEPLTKSLDFDSNLTEEEFKQMVEEIKGKINKGNVMQVIISRRLECEVKEINAIDIYQSLRDINPSPYTFYVDCGDFKLIGASPENLIKLEGKRVETRPVASTYPRGEEENKIKRNFSTDSKEISEHMMLQELCRSELKEVCEPNSIIAKKTMDIEKYSHIIHFVSTLQVVLKGDKDSFDLLRTVFPSATITGRPKRKAMEIIEKIEPSRRGPYTGAIGYITPSGDMDFGIIEGKQGLHPSRLWHCCSIGS